MGDQREETLEVEGQTGSECLDLNWIEDLSHTSDFHSAMTSAGLQQESENRARSEGMKT
jgi:hypothetical protein